MTPGISQKPLCIGAKSLVQGALSVRADAPADAVPVVVENNMPVIVKASDLKFRYPRDVNNRDRPKFTGLPDPAPFNRDDLYDILAMLTAVMNELGSDKGEVLHILEDLLNLMPRFISERGEVFDYLRHSAQECLRP
jgi:hypothetical protein